MPMPVKVPSAETIRRYGVSGPRYTSYPTALSFSPDVGEPELRQAIGASNDQLVPPNLTLYAHIPFCRSLCYYCGCHKKVTRNRAVVQRYLTALHRDICARAAQIDDDRIVDQLHWGGGTPTYLNAGQRASLMDCIGQAFRLSTESTRDFSIEIDPRTLPASEVQGLADIGFNRISIGVQDFLPAVQAAVNREHSPQLVDELMTAARDANFASIGLDLIYGLPHQNVESFCATLDTVVALQPDTLSVFNYAHLPERFPAQRLLRADDMPDAQLRIAIFRETVSRLSAAGYEFIGMDHFALTDSPLAQARRDGKLHRNFQGYSVGAGNDTLGFGASAISQVGGSYFQSETELPAYFDRVMAAAGPIMRGYVATAEDRRVAHAIQDIMCHASFDKRAWGARFRECADTFFAAELQGLQALASDGLVVCGADRIDVTPKGLVFLRVVAQCFDRHSVRNDRRCSQII
ncbi:MAG: oxygen-independent coproporphyrinogen III oxidase [Pseudomonadota bacterium]